MGYTQAQTVQLATAERPFALMLGDNIGPVVVEFETYGRLNAAKDNAVLIVHALSGDAHVAGWDRDADRPGRQFRKKHAG